MEIDMTNIDFVVALNTFKDEVADKLEILGKMELEFLRTFEHRVNISEYHSEMIYEIRKIVAHVEEMYKDARDYFVELRMEFAYEFVRKLQTIMVIGYNHLSQALLITYDMFETEKRRNEDMGGPSSYKCPCQAKNDYQMSKNEFRRLQHIDYTINSLETQQTRLANQMTTIYDRMMLQKGLIQKVKPSLATKQLQQMKDHIQTVMQNNQKLFQQTYMMKFFQFHNHIKKLDKPEKITEVYNKMNQKLQKNFVDHAMKAAKRIQHQRRYNPDNVCSVEVQTVDVKARTAKKDVPKSQPISVFNQTANSGFNQNGATQFAIEKEKKLNQKMSVTLNMLQKQNAALVEELSSYKQAEQEIQVKYRQIVQKFSVVQQLYNKTKIQLDNVKYGEQFNMQQLIIQNKKLKQQIIQYGGRFTSSFQLANTSTQTDLVVQRNPRVNSSGFGNGGRESVVGEDLLFAQEKEIQTYEQYLLPTNDDDVIRLLKNRNQKTILTLNEKEKKIKEINAKITKLQNQNHKIKSTLSIFVQVIEEKLIGSRKILNSPDEPKEKQSILEMNFEQIEPRMKKILHSIVMNPLNLGSQIQEKSRKAISIKAKPCDSSQDDIEQSEFSEELLSENNTKVQKSISNFPSDLTDQKGKRLNVIKKIEAWCQTQLTLGVEVINVERKQFSRQKIVDSRQTKIPRKKKTNIRSSIDSGKQKPINSNEQRPFTNQRNNRNLLSSDRNFQTATKTTIEFKKRGSDERIHLNSFQQIKMISSSSRKVSERQSPLKTEKRAESEFVETNQNSAMNQSFWKISKADSIPVLKNEAFKISSFTNEIYSKGKKYQKGFHKRMNSDFPSTFRPITQSTEYEKQNDLSHVQFHPANKMAIHGLDKMKAALNSYSQFSKFKGDHNSLTKRGQKKRTLLLSIQSCKGQNINVNDMMLGKCLTKMAEKWGKDKIKRVINSIFVEQSS